MSNAKSKQDWILLVHQLPPRPTNLRVRTWRKLQKLGAIAIKNSVYVLPFNEKTYEDFQWLKQEIESTGGEATVFRAGAVEGTTDDEIIAAFRQARDEEYSPLTAELDGLAGAAREQKRRGHLGSALIKANQADPDRLERLHRELERIIAIDFFIAPGRSRALAAYERCRKILLALQGNNQGKKTVLAAGDAPDLTRFQGRRWVTRKKLFVDRLASIWLIKRFIDRRPRFSFISEGDPFNGGIAFDMYGGQFTHEGEDCTIETMIRRFGLDRDPGLVAIAEIVHDIDLKDGKFGRLEAPGFASAIRGLAELLKDDRKLVEQSGPIFDGLYGLYEREARSSDPRPSRNAHREKRARNNAGKRSNRRRQR